jgi:hypothetical protein
MKIGPIEKAPEMDIVKYKAEMQAKLDRMIAEENAIYQANKKKKKRFIFF